MDVLIRNANYIIGICKNAFVIILNFYVLVNEYFNIQKTV